MKASKALKRLGKIESLLSDLTIRYSPVAPPIQEALEDAMAAVARTKAAVSLASIEPAKNPPVKPVKPPAKAITKKTSAKKKVAGKARRM